MRPVQFDPCALADFQDAANYYGARALALRHRFTDSLEAATHLIADAPERWPKVRGEIRKYLLRDFPYSVFYVDRGFEVFIVAVAHHKRNPSFWLDRLG